MTRRVLCAFLFAFTLAISPGAAQGIPATPDPTTAPVGVLAEFPLDELPTPHAEVWFIRMELAPGGSLPESVQIGPIMVYVESGELTLLSNVQLEMGTGTTPDAMATPAGMRQTVLDTGESAMVPSGAMLEVSNASEEPVTFLVLLMYPAELEGTESEGAGEPVGLTQVGVSVGTAEFMPIPATVTMERVVLEPGAVVASEPDASAMEMPGFLGMELGAIESGAAEVTLVSESMENMTWDGMLEGQMSRPEMVPLEASVELETGDAYSFHGSTLTWTNTSDEPLTILRVVISPEMPMQ